MLFDNKSLCKKDARVIVCCEKNKTFKAFNDHAHFVYKYKIDGDIIPSSDSRNRCDYLLEDETNKSVFLIELKGTQLLHAVMQIESTIGIFDSKFNNYTIFPRIIYHNNTHDIHSSTYRKFKSKYPKTRAETDYMEERL